MEVCRKTSRELSIATVYSERRLYRDCSWTECALLALRELVLSHFLIENISLICALS